MKIARYLLDGRELLAARTDGGWHLVEGNLFGAWRVTEEEIDPARGRLLPPVTPPNVVAIGLNYRRHAMESGMPLPARPVIFLKATTSVAAHGEPILLPKEAPDEVDYEAELAIVVGRTARDVREEDAADYILGYTCANDVSARDCQMRLDVQWARGKSFDTFCPVGPWIETELEADAQPIETRVNGRLLQSSNTADMIFSTRALLSYCSRCMTLLPGTLILTGTPEGVGFARKPPIFLRAGDCVQVEIGGIGVLENPVAAQR